ncbi:putative bifunctional diguanylate cyclase/phosphodiesterase [Sinorhizobium meliloti]|jgi:diguanylate cyclase|uniref:putative bifunctional diguanylate cyclase/phosphodiesterase n=1 Tax=Sinorhizobium TaxID=28105 RepID=UPI0023D8BBF0|nr:MULTISPECIES: EAL domain-containing protein [unclassified Sinorhizobium]WEJ15631.1 EAL domain-containing protein [Sinorhizobium sp. K101]WEJ36782.1 EAL domain-containing protein [Sinorhizobium sp. C101]GCA47665.1 oxygen sensor protein DosP [Sinorhizobium sp. KGO-5]
MRHTLAEGIEIDLQAQPPRLQSVELQTLYRREGDVARRAASRQGLWVAVAVYLLFAATDILLVPDVAFYAILARLAVGATAIAAIEVLFRLGAETKWFDLTCAGALVAGYWGWLFPSLMTSQAESISYYMIFGAIFMMGANLFFSFHFRLSVVTSGIVLATFFLALAFYIPKSVSYQVAFGTFYVSCFVFTSYVNWKLNRERYKVFLNAFEAKIQQKEASDRGKALLRLSHTDSLTGLDNRRAVDQKLRDYWSDWQRGGKSFAAILIDVDFFKRYNDFYGHQEGDRCLVLVANALKESIAPYDGSIGRYGGEEFIVLARLKTREQAADLAEAVRHSVETLALPHEQRRDGMSIVTVSVGAGFTRNQIGSKLERLIHEADRALYGAKANGRNCARLFDPNDPQSSDESENIAALLKIAIDQNLVSLVYQPIRDVATGRVDAVEALMRLKMLDGTSVPPSLFVPIAERTGAILDLGRWVIGVVCQELLASEHVPVVSVNVSPIQLRSPGFAASVAAILGDTGVAGSRLAFEITEGLEMEMHSDILRCIADLKTLGIRIWLDDFGTGFAGLSWLRLIDFDTVKIDRSFLHDCDTPKGKAMLRDIIGLVRNRGHKILVEGVETEEQLALMRQFRIDHVQGFHVGRPAPARNFQPPPPTDKRRTRAGPH